MHTKSEAQCHKAAFQAQSNVNLSQAQSKCKPIPIAIPVISMAQSTGYIYILPQVKFHYNELEQW